MINHHPSNMLYPSQEEIHHQNKYFNLPQIRRRNLINNNNQSGCNDFSYFSCKPEVSLSVMSLLDKQSHASRIYSEYEI